MKGRGLVQRTKNVGHSALLRDNRLDKHLD